MYNSKMGIRATTIVATEGFSGSLTGSITGNAVSSSFATTASFAMNGGGGGTTFPYTGDAQISGSLGVTGSVRIKDTAGMTIPVGTTAERIYPPPTGMIRYNTDLNVPEYYNAGDDNWYKMGQARHYIEYVAIAGGGGGGAGAAASPGAGGGAGGYRSSVFGSGSGGGAVSESALYLYTNVPYRITIGAGGAGGIYQATGAIYNRGTAGSNTFFIDRQATGGGGGGAQNGPNGTTGGSGGGGANGNSGSVAIGDSTQGFRGGSGSVANSTGGGGGAGSVGGNTTSTTTGGNGGNGIALAGTGSFTGSLTLVAGGGGGAGSTTGGTAQGGGGAGGGGAVGTEGEVNTGGGGGGSSHNGNGAAGGSGFIRIIHSGSIQMFASAGVNYGNGTFTRNGQTFYWQDITGAGDNDYITFV